MLLWLCDYYLHMSYVIFYDCFSFLEPFWKILIKYIIVLLFSLLFFFLFSFFSLFISKLPSEYICIYIQAHQMLSHFHLVGNLSLKSPLTSNLNCVLYPWCTPAILFFLHCHSGTPFASLLSWFHCFWIPCPVFLILGFLHCYCGAPLPVASWVRVHRG